MQIGRVSLFAVGACLLAVALSQAAPGWTRQTSHTLAKLGGVHFLDENTGFVAGDSAVVLKTRDGGTTWIRLSVADTVGLMEIHATDTNTVFATAWNGGGVHKTTNGGGAWSVSAPPRAGANAMGIWFTSPQRGFFCSGTFPHLNSRIIRTTNGGASWDTVHTSSRWLSYVHFPDAGHGYATEGNGSVVKTTDSGATWTATVVNDSVWMSGVFFLNKDTGFVGGAGGVRDSVYRVKRLFRTTNGGANWTTVNTAVVAAKLAFVDDTTGYLIGGDSMFIFGPDSAMTTRPPKNIRLMKTQDGGSAWQWIDLGTTANMNGLCFPSPHVGYAVGDSGIVYKYQSTAAIRDVGRSRRCDAMRLELVASDAAGLLVQYSLPSGAPLDVAFALQNLRGERVWSERLSNRQLAAGSNTAALRARPCLAAGTYVLIMSVTNSVTGQKALLSQVVPQLP